MNCISSFLIIITLLCSCSSEKPGMQAPPAPDVVVVTVEPETIPAIYEYVGFAQSSHDVEIRAQVSGYLEDIGFSEGGSIKQGDVLFRIDPRQYQAVLDSTKADLEKQEAALWESKRVSERLKSLFEKKASSRRDVDNAIADELGKKALVESGKAKVREAELNLEYATIKAPVSGVIGASNFRLGALIVPNESLLTTISVNDPIWVNFSISERDVLRRREEIRLGQIKMPKNDAYSVEVVLADGSTLPEMGKVEFSSPTYDQKTGTMQLRAVIPNHDNTLRPGQFVRARIHGVERPDAIVIPQRAVMQSKKGMRVYIVDKENKVEERFVEPGAWYQEGWIIKSGLKAGDRVIVDGINKIRPGMTVNIISPELPEQSS